VKSLLLLWDVDHTLIEGGRVGKEIYRETFAALVGHRPRLEPDTDGRTDLAIMTSLLRHNGIDPDSVPSAELRDALARTGERLAPVLHEVGHALPGAPECLAAFATEPDVVQSLLTGNVAPNARMKVSTFGLEPHLDLAIGGYGEDGPVRAQLVAAAWRRARERYGLDPSSAVVVLVGDTPRDAEAGVDGGARVLGVATGRFGAQELLDAGADLALDSLRDTAAVLDAVRHLRALGPRERPGPLP
jgi:phosphoglycolate phosphatase-like HAD superfamily hydrolase